MNQLPLPNKFALTIITHTEAVVIVAVGRVAVLMADAVVAVMAVVLVALNLMTIVLYTDHINGKCVISTHTVKTIALLQVAIIPILDAVEETAVEMEIIQC
jgi:hypothetical protein